MKQSELKAIAAQALSEISVCEIIERTESLIRFRVDDNLSSPEENLYSCTDEQIIEKLLGSEQIDLSLANIVACSFTDTKQVFIGHDTMWQTFLTCFAEHRPIVLSPDMIWLVIAQSIASHIKSNAEFLRKIIVNHDGIKTLIVDSATDIFCEDTDWREILEEFYSQLSDQTKGSFMDLLVNNFSTTTIDSRIASISTIMGGVESYFKYIVRGFVCGIPEVTLCGRPDDWKKIQKKAEILNSLGMASWYEWLEPILSEFTRTSEGYPNRVFWQSTVLHTPNDEFGLRRGCLPISKQVDGWCHLLFPYYKGGELRDLGRATTLETYKAEMMRTKFEYHRIWPSHTEIYDMELWAGFTGVKENPETFALEPQIGWFVRESEEEKEAIYRLRWQDRFGGIKLPNVDEVPIILKKLNHIQSLEISFNDKIELPEWMDEMQIDNLIVVGVITPSEKKCLKQRFKGIKINPRRKT